MNEEMQQNTRLRRVPFSPFFGKTNKDGGAQCYALAGLAKPPIYIFYSDSV